MKFENVTDAVTSKSFTDLYSCIKTIPPRGNQNDQFYLINDSSFQYWNIHNLFEKHLQASKGRVSKETFS